MSHGARHGLDREPEIVGHILARHRKLNGISRVESGGHFEQEGSNALLGTLDEKQQVLLDAIEFASRGPILVGSITIAFGERDDGAASNHQYRHVVDRFGGKLVLVADFEAENITREVEAADLTPTAEPCPRTKSSIGYRSLRRLLRGSWSLTQL
jgi:hypothetical protein